MKTTIFIIILVFLFACTNSNTHKGEEKQSLKTDELEILSNKYNAIKNWDTLDYKYTIQYQDLFSDTNKFFLVDKFLFVNDIWKKNDKYYLSCNNIKFYFVLECTNYQVNVLKNLEWIDLIDIGIIIKVNKIKKMDIVVGSEIEYNEEQTGEDSYVYTSNSYPTIESSSNLLIHGRLIDFTINKSEKFKKK